MTGCLGVFNCLGLGITPFIAASIAFDATDLASWEDLVIESRNNEVCLNYIINKLWNALNEAT